jgi:hypothetical protein
LRGIQPSAIREKSLERRVPIFCRVLHPLRALCAKGGIAGCPILCAFFAQRVGLLTAHSLIADRCYLLTLTAVASSVSFTPCQGQNFQFASTLSLPTGQYFAGLSDESGSLQV